MPAKITYRNGERIGDLIYLKDAPSKRWGKQIRRNGVFICTCGENFIANIYHVKVKDITSCGCNRGKPTHNRSRTVLYGIWMAMKQRCSNRSTKYYHRYGGRGIKVCKRWQVSFENFVKDMGERPSPKHSLDRFPNKNGDYKPTNCRWATQTQQCNNTSRNRILTYNGQKKSISEWARIVEFSIGGIIWRLDVLNWSIRKALETPKIKIKKLSLLLIIILIPMFCISQDKKDTIPCILQVSDTLRSSWDTKVYWIKGYKVIGDYDTFYLDILKQPLRKSIIVWLDQNL